MRRIPLKTTLFPWGESATGACGPAGMTRSAAGGGWQMLTSGEAFGSGVAEGFTEELQAAGTNAGITGTIFIKCIFKPIFKIANSLVMCILFFSQLAGKRIRFLLPGVLLIKCSLQVSSILIRSTEPLLIPLPFFFL